MLDRRQLLTAGMGLTAGLAATTAVSKNAQAKTQTSPLSTATIGEARTFAETDQTETIQLAINAAALDNTSLHLPAGRYVTGPLNLPANTHLTGVPGRTFLEFRGGACASAKNASNIRLQGIVFDGRNLPLTNSASADALLNLINVDQIDIRDCRFQNSGQNAVSLRGTSGKISDNEFMICANAGIFALDSTGLEITQNHVHDCGNNGIQVWRTKKEEDGTLVALNRIERIRSDNGGSGQNGNGINIFRAANVTVASNIISDCAYSAIRSNAGSNCQFTGNNCSRLGEVAMYAEFDFEGALIANNIIDSAATGIAITNFNNGGRLAVVQGNLIRNLFKRDHYDARGIGISAEADTLVSANTIENAPTAGILLGWGKYLRDVTATGNLIRNAGIGIGISVSDGAGKAAATNNMISSSKNGAIRTMNHGETVGNDLTETDKYVTGNLSVSGNIPT